MADDDYIKEEIKIEWYLEKPNRKSFVDLEFKKFDRLLILGYCGQDKFNKATWLVICDCGVIKRIIGSDVISCKIRSCGCLSRECNNNRKHGLRSSPLYMIWYNMIRRCTDSTSTKWKDYGGRGISVCERWLNSIENFIEDMEESYFEGAEIDRKENNGNYIKDNCRWVTRIVNCRNKRSNRLIEYNGETKCIAEWSDLTGIKSQTIRTRLDRGWTIARALTP